VQDSAARMAAVGQTSGSASTTNGSPAAAAVSRAK
jgi:hypothetical protein